jgi:hypothetical protein
MLVAEEVLLAMRKTRQNGLIVLALGASVVLLTLRSRACAEPPSTEPSSPCQTLFIPRLPVPAKDPERPLRVLLLAGEPTREYQFVRALFIRQLLEGKLAWLSIHLQSGEVATDVPNLNLASDFPTRLRPDDKKPAPGDRHSSLATYDVIVAIDPDWTRLTEQQQKLLKKWVGMKGRGLILVAGGTNTYKLSRPALARKLQPVLDFLPVRVEDGRLADVNRDSSKPHALRFPAPKKFLQLDEEGKDVLGGWSEFFFGKARPDWQKTDDRPLRGLYAAYPVKSLRPAATVVASFRDSKAEMPAKGGKGQDLPYLVVMPYWLGKVIFLGSGETWRLRQFRDTFHERFWTQLVRYAASPVRGPSMDPEPGRPGK